MANAKNTIQNIPLIGNLNLNTLKTDVSQFEGFNEKNSTIFGGELAPFYKKYNGFNGKFWGSDYSVIFDDTDPYFLTYSGYDNQTIDGRILDKNNNYVMHARTCIPLTSKINVDNAIWATQFYNNIGIFQMKIDISDPYLLKWKCVHANVESLLDPDKYLSEAEWQNISLGRTYENKIKIIAGITQNASHECVLKLVCEVIDKNFYYNHYIDLNIIHFTYNPSNRSIEASTNVARNRHMIHLPDNLYRVDSTITMTDWEIYWFQHSGKVTKMPLIYKFSYTDVGFDDIFSNNREESFANNIVTEYYLTNINTPHLPNSSAYLTDILDRGPLVNFNPSYDRPYPAKTYKITPYYLEKAFFTSASYESEARLETIKINYNYEATTGHNGEGFVQHYINIDGRYIPNISEQNRTFYLGLTMLDAGISNITYCGIPIALANSIDPSTITFFGGHNNIYGVSYSINNIWYSFTGIGTLSSGSQYTNDLLKNIIIDNRYILFMSPDRSSINFSNVMYDIKTKTLISNINYLGYVPELIPSVSGDSSGYTSAYYGSGFNASYENNPTNPFTGYLPNAINMSFLPAGDSTHHVGYYSTPRPYEDDLGIQFYLSVGDLVSSATYKGEDPKYDGVVYPIDEMGNIIYPISLNSKIIKGYFNNDMISTSGQAYPLIYYNNNIKKYGYYALASVSNITGTFNVQTQPYAYDNNNIYSVTFSNGVISDISAICYKENIDYIGTLPKTAIFYSKFNRTFYQFTGDAVLAPMFEASDINTIYNVYTNPSTLSLWIHTDKGIYVLSDKDMFKLPYIDIRTIKFLKNSIIIAYIGEEMGADVICTDTLSLIKEDETAEIIPIKVETKYYGLGNEQKAAYDCIYIRAHADDKRSGYIKLNVNTITNTSDEVESKTFKIEPAMYDSNNIIYVKYQPKFQSAVAMKLNLETNLGIYSVSVGVNVADTVAQVSRHNF